MHGENILKKILINSYTQSRLLTTDSLKFAINDSLWLNDWTYKYEIHCGRPYKFPL